MWHVFQSFRSIKKKKKISCRTRHIVVFKLIFNSYIYSLSSFKGSKFQTRGILNKLKNGMNRSNKLTSNIRQKFEDYFPLFFLTPLCC